MDEQNRSTKHVQSQASATRLDLINELEAANETIRQRERVIAEQNVTIKQLSDECEQLRAQLADNNDSQE